MKYYIVGPVEYLRSMIPSLKRVDERMALDGVTALVKVDLTDKQADELKAGGLVRFYDHKGIIELTKVTEPGKWCNTGQEPVPPTPTRRVRAIKRGEGEIEGGT